MTDVTRVLAAIDAGDPHAAARLLPLVYDELRKLAAAQMAREKPGQTLDATALVHEAYLRLVRPSRDREGAGAPPLPGGHGSNRFAGSRHFFVAAAEAMRRILVENARRKARVKHGGVRQRQELREDQLLADVPDEQILALDEALGQLAILRPDLAELVKLRYFVQMTVEQTAAVLGTSPRTVKRNWVYASAWLRRAIERGSDE